MFSAFMSLIPELQEHKSYT